MTDSKTVVITGGSRGIGEFLVRKYTDLGYSVIFSARESSGLERKLGSNVRFVKADVRVREDHNRLTKTALDWTGRLDVYINNAGVSVWKPVADVTEEFWDLLLDTNLKGLFWGCQAAAVHFLQNKVKGCIVNVSSLASKRGSANNSVYCASKFGVNGVTQSLAKELGPRGIRVNAICPVYVITDTLTKSLSESVSPTGGAEVGPYLADWAKGNAALARLPLGEEVADLCAYLSSDTSSAVTGQCINVDCGVLPS